MGEDHQIPHRFVLEHNYPNPFNPQTTIAYRLNHATRIALKIFNVEGSVVRILDEGKKLAGTHITHWDGCDESGCRVASGVYFYQLEIGVGPHRETVDVKKMVFFK